jgi:glycosyltransferase involved in cell wall biosynthesis
MHPKPDKPRTNAPTDDGALEHVDFKLSIIVPAYNEERSVRLVLERLAGLDTQAPYEVIVVDDGSSDDTYNRAVEFASEAFKILRHTTNRGKGAAVRSGIEHASGSHVLIFDADDEYDHRDIPKLIQPLFSGRAEVVYGARMRGHGTIHPTLIHALGNYIMTATANILYGSAISDLHTCLKLLPLPLLKAMELTEAGFGLDTEITAELLRRGWRPYELPISYVGRSKEEGKKIGAKDAVECFRILFQVRRRGRIRPGKRDKRLSPPVRLTSWEGGDGEDS